MNLTALKSASSAQLQQMSPAEKLDVFSGRYDYPTVRSEWQRTSPDDATWEGLCHGWAPASMFYKQPNPVKLTNSDGIVVPFGSSDIKALLTYFVGTYDEAFSTSSYLAQRCNYDLDQNPNLASRPSCSDMNAGTFFVQLTNQVSKIQQGFVVDRDRSIQVWNQPVYQYSIGAPIRTGSTVNFTMTYTYGKETQPQWNAHPVYPYVILLPFFFFFSLTLLFSITEKLAMSVNLDSNGNVIGGDYGEFDRPDFAWSMQIADFSGYFKTLRSIYEASTNSSVPKHAVRRTAALARSGHTVLSGPSGVVRIGAYKKHQARRSWSLSPVSRNGVVKITFNRLSIERQFDMVRIYEVDRDGELGALLTVMHGSFDEPRSFSFSTSVYVSFTTHGQTRGGKGFDFVYAMH